MKKRILSFLLALCMCLTLVPVTVLADDDVQQINDAAVQTITPGSDVSVQSVVPDTGAYRTYKFYSGETLLSEQIVKNGDTLLEPEVPAQDGKVFTGWDSKVDFGTVSGITETETIEVHAKFEEGYHVYFKAPDGRIIATKTGKTDDSISVADVTFPVNSNEAITGWYTDKSYADGTKVTSVTISGADITLYAKVEKGYWITFESNGGSYVAPAFYANGATAKSPDEPTKSGYTFDGWYTVNDEKITDFSTITETTTLYAKWTENGNTSYTVIHWLENADDDGYSYKESETKTGTTGSTTQAKAKSYDGFTVQTITQETIAGDGSTIVSVKYKRNVYEVRFYNRYGTSEATGKRITAKYGANIADKWPGGSWYVSQYGSTAQANLPVMPLGGKNFYGTVSEGKNSTYYYVEVLPGDTGIYNSGRYYKLDHTDHWPSTWTVTKEDRYDITGFTFDHGTSIGSYLNNAKFYYTRNSYDIVFISGGKTVKTEPVKYQASITGYANYEPDNAPTGMEDYVFGGWYANKECTGDAYVFAGKTMPANSITLYAKWVAPTYTVTVYDVDGETVLKTFTKVAKNSTIDEANMPVDKVTKDTDDEFLGWVLKSNDNSLDGMPFNFSTRITKDYELRAKGGSKAQYSVTYNANATGTTGSVSDIEKYAKGAMATVKSNGFDNGDKVFLSWNTEADGSGTTYYPNGTVKITGNVTLYAQWGDKASTVQLTYKANGGTGDDITDTKIPNNDRVTLRDENTFTRTGYHFTGWNTQADGKGTSFNAAASARVDNLGSGNVLYAQWAINQYAYTVEYYIDGEKNDSMTETHEADFGTVIDSYTNKCPDGYVLDKTENLPLTIGVDKSANVIKVFYKKNVFNLTIHYVYAEGGKAADDHTESVTFNSTYNVASPTIDGYTADKATVSGTMPARNVEETVTYTKRSDLSYTVNYYWNDKTTLLDSKTVNGQTFHASVTESPIAIEGYTAVSNADQTITIGVTGNVINFYYYKNVELTAVSDSKVYNGSEQTISGYTADITGVTFDDISASGSGTDVGEYDVTFATNPVNTVDITKKYIVTKATPGKLTITPAEVTVTIKGNTDEATYDGEEHSVTDFKVKDISNDLYKEEYFALKTDAKAEAKGTNAGGYPMNLTKDSFENKNPNFEVTFVVEDGKLTIKPAEVTVTIKGNTAEVIYNGEEQRVEGYTFEITDATKLYTANDFVLKNGEAVAKGTNANDPEGAIKFYPMGLTKESFENRNPNFAVTFEVTDGKLTIAKRDVTVTGESATKVYNGQTQEINGYTVDNLVKGHVMTGVTYSAKGKDPGQYNGSFNDDHKIVIKDAAGTDVTANYNVKTVIGVLTITQPSHPTRPSTPTKDVTSVKTADSSQMALWMSMMLASAAGIVFLGKKRKEEQ